MAKKLRDVVAKVGEYTDPQTGQLKGRWQNVGALMKGDDGGEFVILNRTFNPAGMPNPQNRESVILSCFKPDNQQQTTAPAAGGAPSGYPPGGGGQGQHNAGTGGQTPPAQQPPAGTSDDHDDDIPF